MSPVVSARARHVLGERLRRGEGLPEAEGGAGGLGALGRVEQLAEAGQPQRDVLGRGARRVEGVQGELRRRLADALRRDAADALPVGGQRVREAVLDLVERRLDRVGRHAAHVGEEVDQRRAHHARHPRPREHLRRVAGGEGVVVVVGGARRLSLARPPPRPPRGAAARPVEGARGWGGTAAARAGRTRRPARASSPRGSAAGVEHHVRLLARHPRATDASGSSSTRSATRSTRAGWKPALPHRKQTTSPLALRTTPPAGARCPPSPC